MKKHRFLVISVCIMVLLFTGLVNVYAKEEGEIRIGVLTDYTGFIADYGPKFRILQDLFFEQYGDKVAGKPIKLLVEDTGSNPAMALDKAKKLIGVDKVHMLVGTILGSVSLTVAPFAADTRIPHIIWYGGHVEAIERGWSYATTPPLETSTYVAGLLAYDQGHRTAVSIGQDYVAGHKFNGGSLQAFIDKGGKVIQKQWVPLGTADFAPYLAAMEQADVCFFWLAGVTTVTFWKQYMEFGLVDKMPLVMTEGDTLFTVWLPEVDPKLAGRISGRTSYTSDVDTPENKKFVSAFTAKTGYVPDAYDLTAYETWILALSTFEKTNGDTDPEKLRQAIRGSQVKTPAGVVRISEEGFPYRKSYSFKLAVVDGKLMRVRTGEYPEQELITLRSGIVP